MPRRGGAEDRSAFDETPGRETFSNRVASGSRDLTPDGQAAREPFDDSAETPHIAPAAPTEPVADVEGPTEPRLTPEEAAANMIIHDDKTIENLPAMSAPELKLIGRCVSLSVMHKVKGVGVPFYYTGLVTCVTYTAVTLMHVNRYSKADFKDYIKREKTIARAGATAHAESEAAAATSAVVEEDAEVQDGAVASPTSGLKAHGYTVEGEVGMSVDGALVGAHDPVALHKLDPAGSLAAATAFSSEEEHLAWELGHPGAGTHTDAHAREETSSNSVNITGGLTKAERLRSFRECVGSIGPIPYITFLRNHVHDVHFGRDPRSSFYSLFQNSERALVDMQYLRMFVRRYLVHTSEGNNPRQVPLYAFVTVRCACSDMDRDLVSQVAREELPGLMRADKAIAKEKRLQVARQLRQENEVQTFRAPQGVFASTGILYHTRIPQITFMIAMVVFFFVLVFILFLAITMGISKDPLTVSYERKLLRYYVASIIVWIIGGIYLVLHSIHMHLPLRNAAVTLFMRLLWSLGSMACSVMVVVVTALKLKEKNMFHYMSTAPSSDVCAFYSRHSCTGFFSPCTSGVTNAMCQLPCTEIITENSANGCYVYVWSNVQLQLIPLLVFAVFLFICFGYGLFMLWKLWTTSTSIMRRARQA